ncbi:MAG: ATP-binding protein [Desulfuromonadaceae bacterium]|nr:ATP-binding protein [Desulfuromonadaceae bacterium]
MKMRISLIAKFTFSTSLILLVFMLLLDNINNKNFRKVMIGYAVSNAEEVANIINQSAYDAMMRNDKNSLYHIIGKIAESEDIAHIRLIDQKGQVVFSNLNAEIGSVIGKHADECIMCHNSESPDVPKLNSSRIITTKSGKEVLGFTKAIHNQPACIAASCHFHGKHDTVLGLLDISISLEMLRKKSREYRLDFFVLTCLLLLMIGTLVIVQTYFLVDIPVQRLVRQSTLVAAGDLESRVPVSSRDELGELSEAFNLMTNNLGNARKELEEWGASLELKVEERTREVKIIENQLFRSEKLASLGQLVAGIAHEINNPLTGILLFASIVSSDKRLDPALIADIDRIISETSRCADIVKRLLEFSRESVAHKESFSLNKKMEEVIALMYQHPNFQNINFIKVCAPYLPDVIADPAQIQQVLVNLFINASQAMPEGGDLKLSTRMSPDGGYVCIEIKDTGHGIPEENLNRIFDPFFTTKTDGTGLGLSISYGIVENNGGKLEVKSRVDEGTAFTLMLPVDDGTMPLTPRLPDNSNGK